MAVSKIAPGNLFSDAAPPQAGERFDALLKHRNLVIERIVSSSSIAPQEYVQAQDEWVVLLQGEALLQVGETPVHLKAGDHLFLPAGQAHTVQRTSEGAMWLAVHLHPDSTVVAAPATAADVGTCIQAQAGSRRRKDNS